MKEKVTLALCGNQGTGKSMLAKHLELRCGFTVFEGSDILRTRAQSLGRVLTTRESYDQFYREQQRKLGLSWMAGVTLASDADRKVQSGLRARPDFERIKQVGGTIIGLVCPPLECLKRIDTDNPKNAATLAEYEAHRLLEQSGDEYGTHTEWCVRNADYIIDTSGSITEVQRSLEDIVSGRIAPKRLHPSQTMID